MDSTPKELPPQSMAEFISRAWKAQRIEGHGIEALVEVPCPFCAAPGFLAYRVLQVESAMSAGATCRECKRGARAIFARSVYGVSFEIVQTAGDEPPAWLEPKPRRDIGTGH